MNTGLLFAILSMSVMASLTVSAQTRPTTPSPETHPETQKAMSTDEPKVEKAARTALEMKVVGVLAIGEGTDRRSSAIIAMKGAKSAQTYSPGQAIEGSPDVRLVRVQNERIEFLNQGKLEYANVRRFPEAGWGGNAPVATSAPASSSGGAGYSSQSGSEASDRLQAMRDARKARSQNKAKGAEGAEAEKPAE